MPGHRESIESERAHHAELVGSHGSLGVGGMLLPSRRLVAVAVPAQVGTYDRVPLGEPRGDPMPHRMGLRIAVQQENRGSAAAPGDVIEMPFASIRSVSNPGITPRN